MGRQEGYIIAIDAGTSAIKCALISLKGTIIAQNMRRVRLIQDGIRVEIDMKEFWGAVLKSLRALQEKIGSRKKKILGLAITGQGDGLWSVNGKGEPVGRAVLWCDARASDIVLKWQRDATMEKTFYLNQSCDFPGNQSALLAYFKKHQPQILKKSRWFLYCKDWLFYKFTGQIATDLSDSSFPFRDFRSVDYSEELLRLYGLEGLKKKLPPIVSDPHFTGQLSPEASKLTLLPAGLPVSTGPYDIPSAVLGSGAINEGDALIILGTTCANNITLKRPLRRSKRKVGLLITAGIDGLYIKCLPVMAGTTSIEWIMRVFASAKKGSKKPFNEIERLALGSPAGSEGLLFHPYISPSGERAPFINPNIRGQLSGLRIHHERQHIIRAVYEGVALAARDCLEEFLRPESRVSICGGGARSNLWCTIFPSCLKKDIVKVSENSGLIGTAMSAALRLRIFSDLKTAVKKMVNEEKIFKPEQKLVEIYEDCFQRFRQMRKYLNKFYI
ncbi:carbohydrate kinase [Candidatus Sumerlaeota bacterium]|nr:carbohydrate kinase [Candidatus Sumerlaeota bacterium]